MTQASLMGASSCCCTPGKLIPCCGEFGGDPPPFPYINICGVPDDVCDDSKGIPVYKYLGTCWYLRCNLTPICTSDSIPWKDIADEVQFFGHDNCDECCEPTCPTPCCPSPPTSIRYYQRFDNSSVVPKGTWWQGDTGAGSGATCGQIGSVYTFGCCGEPNHTLGESYEIEPSNLAEWGCTQSDRCGINLPLPSSGCNPSGPGTQIGGCASLNCDCFDYFGNTFGSGGGPNDNPPLATGYGGFYTEAYSHEIDSGDIPLVECSDPFLLKYQGPGVCQYPKVRCAYMCGLGSTAYPNLRCDLQDRIYCADCGPLMVESYWIPSSRHLSCCKDDVEIVSGTWTIYTTDVQVDSNCIGTITWIANFVPDNPSFSSFSDVFPWEGDITKACGGLHKGYDPLQAWQDALWGNSSQQRYSNPSQMLAGCGYYGAWGDNQYPGSEMESPCSKGWQSAPNSISNNEAWILTTIPRANVPRHLDGLTWKGEHGIHVGINPSLFNPKNRYTCVQGYSDPLNGPQPASAKPDSVDGNKPPAYHRLGYSSGIY